MKFKKFFEEQTSFKNFYHVCQTSNVESILTKGLIPQIGDRSSQLEKESGIYLFGNIEDVVDGVTNWLGDEFGEDEELTLLSIKLPNDWPLIRDEFEYVSKQSIPPKYIEVTDIEL